MSEKFEFKHDPSVRELREAWNISHSKVYELLKQGTITSFKVGRSTRLHREVLNAMRNGTQTKTDNAA